MITLSKLAKLANVSVSTASKAFSMSNEVNEQTREMIFEIAKKHGCFKKFYNAKYPKYVIAVICPEFKSGLYSMALSLLQEELEKRNCEMCVASTDFSEQKYIELLEYYNRYTEVDAIIVVSPPEIHINDIEIPIAHILATNNMADISVVANLKPAVCNIIEYFKNNNILDIGFIGELHTEGKLKIFKEVMHEKGLFLNPDYISISEKRFEKGGYMAMNQLFEKQKVPKAIICAYDNMAKGAIRCIYDNRLKVPDDILVFGMDNNYESEYLNPPLSSADYHLEDASKVAVDALIRKLNGSIDTTNVNMECRAIFRKSSEIE